MKKSSGFTLVELIIVISIILILATVAVPGILNYQSKQIEDQAVNTFINQFRNYQQISLSKEKTVSVNVSNSKYTFCEDSKCENTNFSNSIFDKTVDFKINAYGDIVNSSNTFINADIVLNSANYVITINKYGGIKKENK